MYGAHPYGQHPYGHTLTPEERAALPPIAVPSAPATIPTTDEKPTDDRNEKSEG
jgi:hypothetical protein